MLSSHHYDAFFMLPRALVIDEWEYAGQQPEFELGCFIQSSSQTVRVILDSTDILIRSMKLSKRAKQLSCLSNLLLNLPIPKWNEEDIDLALEILGLSLKGTREEKLTLLLSNANQMYNLVKKNEK